MWAFFLALILPSMSFAADITAVGPLPYDDSHPKPRAGCTHGLTGQIGLDDLAKIQALPTDPQTVLCLDSPGGVCRAGVQIGAYMRETGIGTRLEENAICESACAIVFMSGTYHADTPRYGPKYEGGWQLGPQLWRSMHPTARLGFHAPRLNVPEGQYDEATVLKAYDIALQGLSEFATTLMMQGDQGDYILWDPNLYAQMIATPHDEMLYIDTVETAGRYKIEIGPMVAPPKQPDARTLIQACVTHYGWAESLGSDTYADALPGATTNGTKVELSNGLPCNFEPGGKDSYWRDDHYDIPDITFFHPTTPLVDLTP